jgi:hypothetical protein
VKYAARSRARTALFIRKDNTVEGSASAAVAFGHSAAVAEHASNKSFDLSRRSEFHIVVRMQRGGQVNSVVMPAQRIGRK